MSVIEFYSTAYLMRLIALTTILTLYFASAFCQDSSNPADDKQKDTSFDVIHDFKGSEDTLNYFFEKLKGMPHTFEDPKGKVRKSYLEVCERRAQYFLDIDEYERLMARSDLVEYVQEISDYLVAANPQLLPHSYKIFIQRSSEMNALNMGENIVFVNIGLLARCKTFEQIAFIIAHEISHDVKFHVRDITEELAIAQHDKNSKKAFRRTNRKKIGGYTAKRNIVYEVLASLSLHSRDNESEADSLGTVICAHAGIDKSYVREALQLLDESDQLYYKDTLDIQEILHTKQHTIEDDELTITDLYGTWSTAESLYVIPDSLKTHPDCDRRIEQAEEMNVQVLEEPNNGIKDELKKKWDLLSKRLEFEYIHCLMEEDNLSLAAYFALCYKKRYGSEPFVECIVSYCFFEFYKAIKEHRFAAYVAFPDEMYSYGYNKFLEFLHAQNSKKFLNMASGIYNFNVGANANSEFATFTREYGFYLQNQKFSNSSIDEEHFENFYYKNKINLLTKLNDDEKK